jgi:hypothetical protein
VASWNRGIRSQFGERWETVREKKKREKNLFDKECKHRFVHVAEPSDVLVYGRIVKATPSHIEVAIRTTKQKLTVSPEIVSFFSASWHSHVNWARGLFSLGETKEESKVTMQEKLAQVKEGMSSMEDSVVKRVVDSAAASDFAGVINESLAALTALLYVRFEGGSLLYNDSFAEFEVLQVAAELFGAGQNVVVQLGCVSAKNIHHHNLAVVLDLEPVHRAKKGSLVSQSSASSAVTIALRRPGKSLGVPTIVELGLSNVAVTSRGTKALSPVQMVDEIAKVRFFFFFFFFF